MESDPLYPGRHVRWLGWLAKVYRATPTHVGVEIIEGPYDGIKRGFLREEIVIEYGGEEPDVEDEDDEKGDHWKNEDAE